MDRHRPSKRKVIPRGYVVMHVVLTDMETRRVTLLHYFVAPGGGLHDAVSEKGLFPTLGPDIYMSDTGMFNSIEKLVYGGVARHYADIVKEDVHSNTFVGASMATMAPMKSRPRIKDKNMLNATIALTTEDVGAIIEALDATAMEHA